MNRKKVAIIFGGKSVEHEVSLQSAKSIIEAIDKDRYDVVLIGIDKQGKWYLNEKSTFLLNSDNPKLIMLNQSNESVMVVPSDRDPQLYSFKNHQLIGSFDVVFPVLHGPLGEDGTIQGLLKLANVPFVGADVLGSAVGMDKDTAKRLLRDAKLPIAKFLTFNRSSVNDIDFTKINNYLGMPCFVKPAGLGSSVGINKVNNEQELKLAVTEALQYDNKVIVEEYIKGREIECSVLGNESPIASIPGEILPKHEFYSYEAKYIDENGAVLAIPAKLPREVIDIVKMLAVETFKTLNLEGMARVDFFLKENNELIINEVNTIPGFTRISMYPKLWEASGISYTELINRLIELAIERHNRDNNLRKTIDLNDLNGRT